MAGSKSKVLLKAAASIAVTALAVTLIVLWPGYDAHQTPPVNASVWALQTGEGKRFARVNTQLGELDTVRDVENPTGVVQSNNDTFVFTDGNQRFARVNPATPRNLDAEAADQFESTPSDTVFIAQEGSWIAYLTGRGDVYAGELGQSNTLFDPFSEVQVEEGEERPHFAVAAVALNSQGLLALYSADLERVVTYDIPKQRISSQEDLPTGISAQAQMTFAAEKWVILDEDSKLLWVQGAKDPLSVGLGNQALLQRSSDQADTIFIADAEGLVEAQPSTQTSKRSVDSRMAATPARPFNLDGVTFAAWMSELEGIHWNSADTRVQNLDFNGQELDSERSPVFLSNGSTAILNEQKSGWVWTLPTGDLVASSQHWRYDEKAPENVADVQAQKVFDPKPPLAEPDSFGVRAGRDAILPVLLNDHDPNEDLLTIVPESLTKLDESFGSVAVTNNGQNIVAKIEPGATGSATFQYRVSDGTSSDGLQSEPATVTLTVKEQSENSAPEWCGTEGCLAEWPKIEVVPGGTQSVETLGAWVDPEGDPVFVSDYNSDGDIGQIIVTPEGLVTFQHPDPQQSEAATSSIELIVSDSRGSASSKTLAISVTPQPQLTFTPFAVTGVPGQQLAIDLTDHIASASGQSRILSANLTEDLPATVNFQTKSNVINFAAQKPGDYVLQVSVADDSSEVAGIVRVTVVDAQSTPITTTPLTAFVRPTEDATIDVLPAITDPSGAVLMLDQLEVDPENDASLAVQLIGQKHLRASGSTADGSPGTLGVATYTVSDGSGAPGRSARGEITFVLLPSSEASPPIAVDDHVVVRSGAQVDIAVLDNDVAPTGSQIQIDPASIVNEHEKGLAFATSTMLRYLAPEEPGDYSVSYSVFRLGHPSQTGTARVRITVLGDEETREPDPPTLEGRVLSGKTITIPFTPSGRDGDAASLERILTQPAKGHASVNAEGDKIEYTSELGHSGQISFTYEVRDDNGQTGTGEVRVGVLNATSDPKPVTYSDYLQVQQGELNSVVVYPLDNDIDPLDQVLKLKDVRPNAPANSVEYAELLSRLQSVDLVTGAVTIASGADLGTDSYVYTVENTHGDTAMGLIIVKVVRDPVPGFPAVRDTRLTTETVESLSAGIDVLTGKVAWNSGEVAGLKLDLWGDPEGFATNGWQISGAQTDRTQVIPFSVTGLSFAGEEVTSYGFLRVPGVQDIKLTLRQAFAEVTVKEKESITVDMSEAVRVPSGERLEVLGSEVAAGGTRPGASCTLTSGTKIRYDAHTGAPWQDSCTVPVKLASQKNYTYLSLRIKVIAEDPRPELRSASVTISPGETQTYDLKQMVTWEGRTDLSSLNFGALYGGSQFEVTQSGGLLTVRANDDAKPAREESVVVSLSDHADVAAANLLLVVGPAPSALPKGATVTGVCTQASGVSSCSIPVIGMQGEVNPLPQTPLKLVSAAGSQNCDAVNFTVENETTILASWRTDAPGAADCSGTFTVQDAQGRVSSGDRVGNVILDLQGLPSNPSRVDWVSYEADSVRLSVVSDSSSYPQVASYRVTGDGINTECPASGECLITGLENGKQIAFNVVAQNSVGDSRGSASVTAWAYKAPVAPSGATFKPLPTTDGRGHLVQIDVTGIDPTTSNLMIARAGEGSEGRSVAVTEPNMSFEYNVGSNNKTDLTITPSTKFEVPPSSVGGGSSTGTIRALPGVHGIGKPFIDLTITKTLYPPRVKASGTVSSNGGELLKIGFATGSDTCVPNEDFVEGAFERSFKAKFASTTKVTVCAEHVDGGVSFGVARSGDETTVVIPAPTGNTYLVGPNIEMLADGRYSWGPITHGVTVEPNFELFFEQNGVRTQNLSEFFVAGEVPGTISALACEMAESGDCSTPVTLVPAGALYSPIVAVDPLLDADGFCSAEDLAVFVTLTDPGNILLVQTHETDGQRILTIRDASSHLDAITLSCSVRPDPDPPIDPELPEEPGQQGDSGE